MSSCWSKMTFINASYAQLVRSYISFLYISTLSFHYFIPKNLKINNYYLNLRSAYLTLKTPQRSRYRILLNRLEISKTWTEIPGNACYALMVSLTCDCATRCQGTYIQSWTIIEDHSWENLLFSSECCDCVERFNYLHEILSACWSHFWVDHHTVNTSLRCISPQNTR